MLHAHELQRFERTCRKENCKSALSEKMAIMNLHAVIHNLSLKDSTKGGSQEHAGNNKDRLPPLTAW